jgi:hypothetical protein
MAQIALFDNCRGRRVALPLTREGRSQLNAFYVGPTTTLTRPRR